MDPVRPTMFVLFVLLFCLSCWGYFIDSSGMHITMMCLSALGVMNSMYCLLFVSICEMATFAPPSGLFSATKTTTKETVVS